MQGRDCAGNNALHWESGEEKRTISLLWQLLQPHPGVLRAAAWPRVSFSVPQAPFSPQNWALLHSGAQALCFLISWFDPHSKLLGMPAHLTDFRNWGSTRKKCPRWRKAPASTPSAHCLLLLFGDNPQDSLPSQRVWAPIKGSFEKEPIIALSIISLLKRDPEVVSTHILYLYFISASIIIPVFNLMLIDRETAWKPYGTVCTTLHHSHFPAIMSNDLCSFRHA